MSVLKKTKKTIERNVWFGVRWLQRSDLFTSASSSSTPPLYGVICLLLRGRGRCVGFTESSSSAFILVSKPANGEPELDGHKKKSISSLCVASTLTLAEVQETEKSHRANSSSWCSHFPCSDLLTLAFHSVCVCVCVCVSSLLANNAAQEVCQDKGPDCEALFWSVRPTFEGDNNRVLLIPEKPARCRREPWIREKGITAPGVFKARAGDVPLAGECCCNMSCFNRGWSKSRSHLQVRPPTEELSGGFACFEVINMQLHFMLLHVTFLLNIV